MGDELRRLLDRQEVADVALRYARAADTRDARLMEQCFTADAVLSLPSFGQYAGIESILDSFSLLSALDITQHVIGNQRSNCLATGPRWKAIASRTTSSMTIPGADIHCRRDLFRRDEARLGQVAHRAPHADYDVVDG